MSGFGLIIAFIISIVVMIIAISKYKIHPFLSIMGVSLVLGLIAGIPLINVTGPDGKITMGLAGVIGAGFSGTFTSIGIVIILGALIGNILEVTGAAFKLAELVIMAVGSKRPELAVMIMGWVVSIPVFCDSGFVILNPIRKALARKTGAGGVAMTVALSAGLYASHVFIPPTPGPIAAANTLGIGDNLLLVMGMGALVSVPALAGSYVYALFIGKRVKSKEDLIIDETAQSYEELVAGYGSLPGGFISLAPIIIPILLMALGSIASMAKWSGALFQVSVFLGTPIIALAAGLFFAIWQLAETQNMEKFYGITNTTLEVTGPILFVTAAGGVLGRVIAVSGMVEYITSRSDILADIGILFPFIIAAILKTAQGSSTVAITTTAGIMAPLTGAMGLASPVLSALTVMAIGAGAMTVSHANDSYFWVVTNFGGMTPEQGYRTQTAVTLVEGICAAAGIWALSLFLR